jgi:hypothetical protein
VEDLAWIARGESSPESSQNGNCFLSANDRDERNCENQVLGCGEGFWREWFEWKWIHSSFSSFIG